MSEAMVQRVIEELRIGRPYDGDELLRAIALHTMLGQAIACKLALCDCARNLADAFGKCRDDG